MHVLAMHRITRDFTPSAVTLVGGVFMGTGSLLYLADAGRTLRNVHWFSYLAFALLAVGLVIATLSAVFVDDRA